MEATIVKSNQKNILTETATAIFIIAAVSFFVLANLFFGFSLYLYAFAVLFGFLASIFYPRAGVYAIVFLTIVFERFFTLVPIYWNRAEYKIYPLDILFVGVILGTVFSVIASEAKQSRDETFGEIAALPSVARINKFKIIDWLVAIFILASAIYFFASAYFFLSDSAIAFSTFKNYAFYGLFYFVIVLLFNDKEKLFQLLDFFLTGAITITIFIFIGAIRGEGLWTQFTPLSTEGSRILAFPHAFFLTMAVLISLAWLAYGRFKSGLSQNFFIVLVPIWTIGILGSLMRHLWISLFVSIVLLFWLLPKEKRIRLKKIVFHYALIVLIFLIILAYLSFLFPYSNIAKFFSSAVDITGQRFASTAKVSSDESLNWRKSVWQATWKDFQHSLVLGLGYGKKVSVEIGPKYKDFVEIRNIHNSLLTIFIQMGLWSVALFGAILWLLAKPFFKKNSEFPDSSDEQLLKIVFAVLFVNYLVAFLFQTYLETNLLGIFFWIILGGLAVIGNINNREQAS